MRAINPDRFNEIIKDGDVLIHGVRCVAQHMSFYFVRKLGTLREWINKTLFLSPTASLVNRREVAIMYFGRTSEFLMMTSERVVIPSGRYTLGQLLCSLYKRGNRWVDKLDDSHLICTVNGREARLFDTIAPGDAVWFSSIKSVFEA